MINPNDCAFVIAGEYREGGLTKRELFAAMAMQGYLAGGYEQGFENPGYLATWSIEQADLLIAALNKKDMP